MKRRAHPNLMPLLAAGFALSALTAACRAEDDASAAAKVATLQDGKSAATASSSASPTAAGDQSEQLVAYAGCMRKNGVDMPDPEVSSDGKVNIRMRAGDPVDGPSGKRGADSPKLDPGFAKAQQACQNLLPKLGGQIDPEKQAEMQQGVLDFAKCMRAEGVDMPDPEFREDGGMVMMRDPGSKSTAEFAGAEKKCRSHLGELGPKREDNGDIDGGSKS